MTRQCDQCKKSSRIETMGILEVYYLGKKVKLIMCDECLEPHFINFEQYAMESNAVRKAA